MRKLAVLIVFLLSFSLAACVPTSDPVSPTPVPPTPPSPTEPVEVEDVRLGDWVGTVHSDSNFYFGLELCIEYVSESLITGTVTFVDEPVETLGTLSGSVVDGVLTLRVESILDNNDSVTFTLQGTVTDTIYTGTTRILGTNAVFQFVWSEQ